MKLTYHIKDLPEVAGMILKNTPSKTLLFKGEMGSGKTTLIKELATQLGVQDTMSSPSFSIINEYALDGDMMYHFDFYRIEDETEALDIGVQDYFESGHWNLIEWPENINSLLPGECAGIELTINQNGSRTLNLMPVK